MELKWLPGLPIGPFSESAQHLGWNIEISIEYCSGINGSHVSADDIDVFSSVYYVNSWAGHLRPVA